MRTPIKILFFVLTIWTCEYQVPKDARQESVAVSVGFTPQAIDSLYDKNVLIEKKYPNMSVCGGALSGFYLGDDLQLIMSKYHAEFGFSSKKIYWNGNKVSKMVYQEYFPRYESHSTKIEEDSLLYSDVVYEIVLSDSYTFKKIMDDTIITNKIDTALLENLIECSEQMKRELEHV